MHLYSLGVDYVYVVRKVRMGTICGLACVNHGLTLCTSICALPHTQLPCAPAADSCSENSEIRSLDIMHGQGAS